jgi:three-Cys-motif partner protein
MNDEYTDREQTRLKHFALRKYLEPATRIIGSGWNNFSYVDCCAGPWMSRSQDFSDTSFGISVAVLRESEKWLRSHAKNTRFKALLIEEKTEPYSRLAAFAEAATGERVQVDARNWDFREHIPEIVRYVTTPRSFSFIFIDPTGWTPAQVGALEPLLQVRPGEVLINLMTSFIVRFVNDEATKLQDILGPEYHDMRSLNHEEQEDEAVRRYCDLIRTQGSFPYVCALPVMKPDQDAIHFYLIFGTRSAKGVEVFKSVEKKTEEETALVRALRQQSKRPTLDLFSADVLYSREERYRRLAARRKEDAQKALWQLLSKKGSVLYDDCWAEALQFPTVYESDLRAWLKDAEEIGSVRIDGRKRPDESPTRDRGHVIVRHADREF